MLTGLLLLLADAIVTIDAMNAPTIAEIFVEESEVRVELEVAVRDLPAFSDLLPDEFQERVEAPERRWALVADDRPLAVAKKSYVARRRVARDPITGEPAGETDERVLAITLRYPLAGRPGTLTLDSPPGVSIGFVLYHRGVAVNDFRYLPSGARVDLDWEDPWYSRFKHRNLRRRFDAPIAAYLYVEPYEIRKEIILRPRDLQRWIDLGVGETIPVEAQPALKEAVARFLATRAPVEIDGEPAEFALDRIAFVRRTLRQTGVIDPPEPLDASTATLGVIFTHPRDGTLPKNIRMRWDLFPERVAYVPASATDEAGGLPSRLTPQDPELVWENFLRNPAPAGFVELPPVRRERPFPWLPVGLAVAAIPLAIRRRFVVVAALLVAAGLLWPRAEDPAPEPGVVGALLRNAYRAFDFRGEETIYDALARSIAGEALTRAYLDIRRSLELENQGGARVKVKEVELVHYEPRGLVADCRWEVTGTVGHWGHLHTRANRYEAELEIRPVDGAWRITRMDVRDEQRLR